VLTQVKGSRAGRRYASTLATPAAANRRLPIVTITYVLRTEVQVIAPQPRTEQGPILQLRCVSRTETDAGLGPVETSPWLSLSLESATSLRRALDAALQGLASGEGRSDPTGSG
jgi:hypothetical protein